MFCLFLQQTAEVQHTKYPIGSADGIASEMAIIMYSDVVETIMNFNGQDNIDGVLETIEGLVYQHGGSTRTGDALERAESMLAESSCDSQVLVVITDGQSNAGVNVCEAAARLKNDAEIYVVGVSSVNQSEMRCLASEPFDDHYYYARSYQVAEHQIYSAARSYIAAAAAAAA
ncbi:PREDICTED: cartilage matrix protein-like [Priapulus caudatus]|uniref:Cartilage matrix protein-like n=1 Tax=Priapulus caudatus TaxID=37621 RepID=A0ABM1F164_PRICU|nr:PREDICTED: cartilage matrix protein-like [Priapulus caudatus]